MLRWRLLLGTILIAALVGLCWLDARAATPGAWLFPVALALGVLASGEFLWLAAGRQLDPLPWVLYLSNILIVSSNWIPLWVIPSQPHGPFVLLGWPLAAVAIGACLAIVGEIHRYRTPGKALERLSLGVFGQVYIGLFLSFIAQLRLLHGTGTPPEDHGIAALASLVIVVKMCDTGAYTVGRLIGRHKMCPVLSPGKTWEGAAGGLAFACLGAWFSLDWLAPRLIPSLTGVAAWRWLLFGIGVGAAGILGDLAESLIKRDVGRKDSSAWMPGFGGVLDLLDSLLFTAPLVWLLWTIGLVRS